MRPWFLAVLWLLALSVYGATLGWVAGFAALGRLPQAPQPTVLSWLKGQPLRPAIVAAAKLPVPSEVRTAAHAGAPGSLDDVTVAETAAPTGASVASSLAARALREHPSLSPQLAQTIGAAVAERASAWHLDPWLVYSVIEVESGFTPGLVGSAGEIGLMQVLPSTARLVAENVFQIKHFDPRLLFDPAWNIRIGTAFLASRIRHFDSIPLGLTAYNAGDAVTRPSAYAARVLRVYSQIK